MQTYLLKGHLSLPANHKARKRVGVLAIHLSEYYTAELAIALNKIEGYAAAVNTGWRKRDFPVSEGWRTNMLAPTEALIESLLKKYGSPVGIVSLHGCHRDAANAILLCSHEGITDFKDWMKTSRLSLEQVTKGWEKLRADKMIFKNGKLTKEGREYTEGNLIAKGRWRETMDTEIGTLHGKSVRGAAMTPLRILLESGGVDYVADECLAGGAEISFLKNKYGRDLEIIQVELMHIIRRQGNDKPYYIASAAASAIDLSCALAHEGKLEEALFARPNKEEGMEEHDVRLPKAVRARLELEPEDEMVFVFNGREYGMKVKLAYDSSPGNDIVLFKKHQMFYDGLDYGDAVFLEREENKVMVERFEWD